MKQEYYSQHPEYIHSGLLDETGDLGVEHLFETWFREAVLGNIAANEAVLATCGKSAQPSLRVVLTKHCSVEHVLFFSHTSSQKGQEIAENPLVSLLFYFGPQKRQVRYSGRVEKIPRKEAEEYFYSRPQGSQVAAFVSEQSQEISSRDLLFARFESQLAEFQDKKVPCPKSWAGFRVYPAEIEFWQGQAARLHDRIVFTKLGENNWTHKRVMP